jgi:hypothetical protein
MISSQSTQAIIDAYKQGYRATKEGAIISHTGRKLILHKTKYSGLVYLSFKMRYNGKPLNVLVHRFVAYQKYGEIAFGCDCVRHLDGNSENNSFDNIEIGTFHENSMDRCEEQRKLQAKHASRFNMVYTDDDVVKIKDFYAATRSYKQTMEKFGISSKATLHNILHNR